MNKVDDSGRVERLYGTRSDSVYTISGIVHVIRNAAELPYVREGEIIVAVRISSEWREQLALAKAIIEDAGATESVAAQMAVQYDIPAVFNVTGAMDLRSGDIVTIHGDGEIERIYDKRAPDSPMRVSVPAAVAARNGHGIITAENVVPFSNSKRRPESGSSDSSHGDESPDDHGAANLP